MKSFLSLFLSVICAAMIVSCTKNNYRIQGTTSADDSSQMMYLYLNRDTIAVDSAKVENHQFVFEGLIHGSRYANVNNGDQRTGWMFFLEEGEITLCDSLWYGTGTPLNDAFVKFNADFDSIEATTDDIADYKQLIGNIWADHSNDALGAYATGRFADVIGYGFIDSLYQSAGEDMTDDIWFTSTRANIETAKRVAPGSMFTDMELVRISEKPGKGHLSDYVGKGKIVVMDCWASWCGPCRELIAQMKEHYADWQKKGVVVLGMATRDKKEDTWAAIEELQIPWIVVSDAGLEKSACETYGFRGIPHVIIFDQNGVILARNIYSESEITNVLNEALP